MTQETAGKIPVMQVAREAYAFLGGNWARFAPAALIVAIVTVVAQLFLLPMPGGILLAPVVAALASVTYSSAVLRHAIRGEYSSPVGLQLGPDEFRMFGVWLGLALIFGPLAGVAIIVMLFMIVSRLNYSEAELNALGADPNAFLQAVAEGVRPIDGLVFLAVCAVAIYLSSRLTMVYAATIGERRMVAFQTWGWSKGNVGRVILAVLLAAIPQFFAAIVNDRVVMAMGPGTSAPLLFVSAATLAWIGLIMSLPGLALGAILYKGLRPPDFQPK